MFLDQTSPENTGVLHYLSQKRPGTPLLSMPADVRDPYMGQGSHPDIVERVWDRIGGALPVDCRCLVHGTPALVHPVTGLVLAICNGTQYNLRLTPADLPEALARGAKSRTRWSDGTEMAAAAELGPAWIFGGWFEEELRWCGSFFQDGV